MKAVCKFLCTQYKSGVSRAGGGGGGERPHCLLPDKEPLLVTVESLSMYAPVSEHIPAPMAIVLESDRPEKFMDR